MLLPKLGRTAISYCPPQNVTTVGRGEISTYHRRTPLVGREEEDAETGLGRYPSNPPSETGRPPQRQEKGSLETVGFKLTFAYFCSAAKVGRRRQTDFGIEHAESLRSRRRDAENSKIGRTENVLPPAAGCPLWGGKRTARVTVLGDIRPVLRQRMGDPFNVRRGKS